jgi:hypothetical protein
VIQTSPVPGATLLNPSPGLEAVIVSLADDPAVAKLNKRGKAGAHLSILLPYIFWSAWVTVRLF